MEIANAPSVSATQGLKVTSIKMMMRNEDDDGSDDGFDADDSDDDGDDDNDQPNINHGGACLQESGAKRKRIFPLTRLTKILAKNSRRAFLSKNTRMMTNKVKT